MADKEKLKCPFCDKHFVDLIGHYRRMHKRHEPPKSWGGVPGAAMRPVRHSEGRGA